MNAKTNVIALAAASAATALPTSEVPHEDVGFEMPGAVLKTRELHGKIFWSAEDTGLIVERMIEMWNDQGIHMKDWRVDALHLQEAQHSILARERRRPHFGGEDLTEMQGRVNARILTMISESKKKRLDTIIEDHDKFVKEFTMTPYQRISDLETELSLAQEEIVRLNDLLIKAKSHPHMQQSIQFAEPEGSSTATANEQASLLQRIKNEMRLCIVGFNLNKQQMKQLELWCRPLFIEKNDTDRVAVGRAKNEYVILVEGSVPSGLANKICNAATVSVRLTSHSFNTLETAVKRAVYAKAGLPFDDEGEEA